MNASSMTLAYDELDSEQTVCEMPHEWGHQLRLGCVQANVLSQDDLSQEKDRSQHGAVSIQGKVTVSF